MSNGCVGEVRSLLTRWPQRNAAMTLGRKSLLCCRLHACIIGHSAARMYSGVNLVWNLGGGRGLGSKKSIFYRKISEKFRFFQAIWQTKNRFFRANFRKISAFFR